MSHFTVLTAVPLPMDLNEQIEKVPERDIVRNLIETAYLERLRRRESASDPQLPQINDQMRLETLTEQLLTPLLAPYDENAENPEYVEFVDCTEEGRKEYAGGTDCVRTPDGRILPAYQYEIYKMLEVYNGQTYQRSAGPLHHRKRTKKAKKYRALPNYPYKKLYSSFDLFMTEHHGYHASDGAYGFYTNPNAQWDWYQIGGRWPYRFLVKEDCATAVCGERSFLLGDTPAKSAPDGYRWVAGARKGDIAWDVMRSFLAEQAAATFRRLEGYFQTGQVPKDDSVLCITEEGITSWGDLVYYKNETLEGYLQRIGLTEQDKYPIGTFALLDGDGWSGSGDMGWFGVSTNNKDEDEWAKMVESFIDKQPDDTLLVSVDCHI